MVDLKSIISLDKIENNLEWIGGVAGALSDSGLATPIVFVERAINDGVQVPTLAGIKHWAWDAPKTGGAVKLGILMATGGAIGKRLLGGLGARVARGVEKFGTGQTLGALLTSVILATQPGVSGAFSSSNTSVTSNSVLWGMS